MKLDKDCARINQSSFEQPQNNQEINPSWIFVYFVEPLFNQVSAIDIKDVLAFYEAGLVQ